MSASGSVNYLKKRKGQRRKRTDASSSRQHQTKVSSRANILSLLSFIFILAACIVFANYCYKHLVKSAPTDAPNSLPSAPELPNIFGIPTPGNIPGAVQPNAAKHKSNIFADVENFEISKYTSAFTPEEVGAFTSWMKTKTKENDQRARVFLHTLKILFTGKYKYDDTTTVSFSTPIYPLYKRYKYDTAELATSVVFTPRFPDTKINIVHMDSFELPYVLRSLNKKTAVLNFANAVHAGGGVFAGCIAQEEELCRRSNLFFSLGLAYYRKTNYPLVEGNGITNTDPWIAGLYSYDVEVFKDIDYYFLEEPFKVDVITAAFLDFRSYPTLINTDEMQKRTLKRARLILKIAAEEKVDVLVLGAIGCGVFCNNNKFVADTFMELIKTEFYGVFEEVHFAIIIGGFETFKSAYETSFASIPNSKYIRYAKDSIVGKEIAKHVLKTTHETFAFLPQSNRDLRKFRFEELSAYKDLVDNPDYDGCCAFTNLNDDTLFSNTLGACRNVLEKVLSD